jgi:hypothetical protein
MAQRRMFSLSVVDTDAFLEMPISSRLLYYELGMRADDDGFVDSCRKILTFTGLSTDDLKVLIAKNFIIPFESGVIVIKHWRLNNYLQNDRSKPTIHQQELQELTLDNNNVYTMDTKCIQNVSTDKNSIDKNSIEYNIRPKGFIKPTVEEIENYCKERKNNIDAQTFYDFYEAANWYRGKTKIKDWKACVRTWEQRNNKKTKQATPEWFGKEIEEPPELTEEEKRFRDELIRGY